MSHSVGTDSGMETHMEHLSVPMSVWTVLQDSCIMHKQLSSVISFKATPSAHCHHTEITHAEINYWLNQSQFKKTSMKGNSSLITSMVCVSVLQPAYQMVDPFCLFYFKERKKTKILQIGKEIKY